MTGTGRTTVAMAAGAGMLLLSVRVLRSRLALIRVTGSSMTPAFADGDRLLVRRTTRVRRGDAVVFRNPVPFGDGDDALAWLIKRVSALPGDAVPPDVREIVGAPDGGLVPPGSLIVRGDAARTQDSRHFGYVPQASLLGVVLTRPTPPAAPEPTAHSGVRSAHPRTAALLVCSLHTPSAHPLLSRRELTYVGRTLLTSPLDARSDGEHIVGAAILRALSKSVGALSPPPALPTPYPKRHP